MQIVKKKYYTTGVVPASSQEPYYDETRGAWVYDGGANWDTANKRWVRTVWVQQPSIYKVQYDDGSYETLKERPEIGDTVSLGFKTVERLDEKGNPVLDDVGNVIMDEVEIFKKVQGISEESGKWQLTNEYIDQGEKPEWDEYMTRQPVYAIQNIEPQPVKKRFGGDWLGRKAYNENHQATRLR